MKLYLRILSFAKPYGRFLPGYLFSALFGIIFGLFNFILLKPVLDVIFETGVAANIVTEQPKFELSYQYLTSSINYYLHTLNPTQNKLTALLFVCVAVVCSVFLTNLFRYISQRIIASVYARSIANMRRYMFKHLTKLHIGYFSDERKGDLMSKTSNDIRQVEDSIFHTLPNIFRDPITLIVYFATLFSMSVRLTLFTLLILPLAALIISFISKFLRKEAKEGQEALGSILNVIDETVSGMRIIKAFNARDRMIDRFDKENNRYARAAKRLHYRMDLASPLSEFVGVAVIAGILFYGGSLVINKNSLLDGSDFITFIIIFSQTLAPIKGLAGFVGNVQKGLAAGQRVFELTDTVPEIADKPDAVTVTDFKEALEFKNVSFSYDKEPVLKDINLTIKKGQTIALVGPSGGGKSTLAELAVRFFDPTAGEILIDGIPLTNCKYDSLMRSTGLVTQESVLFNDTIFENIAFSKASTTEELVVSAAKAANAHDFIIKTENGYQTTIGESGSKLSGGQRQRISIARALLKNPEILVLDEATSALDSESEKLVQDALLKLMKNRTSLVIAHRLSTIRHANEIVVIDQGRITERGTHDELMLKNGMYANMYKMQVFD